MMEVAARVMRLFNCPDARVRPAVTFTIFDDRALKGNETSITYAIQV
jgi:hypothetical protein